MSSQEFLEIVDDLYKVNPAQKTKQNLAIVDDAINRLDHYYRKIMKTNFTQNDSLHFGYSENFRFGIITGLLLSERILAQDIGIISLATKLKEALLGKLDASKIIQLIQIYQGFVTGLQNIRDFIETSYVIYIPHRDLWRIFDERYGSRYQSIVSSEEYSLIKISFSRILPEYTTDGFIASFTLSTSPYSDDRGVIVGLKFLSDLSIKSEIGEIFSIYFHKLKVFEKERRILEQLNISNNIQKIKPEMLKELRKKYDPKLLRESLEKTNEEKINDLISKFKTRVEDISISKTIAKTFWIAISLASAIIFTKQPLESIGKLISALGYAQGIVELIKHLKDSAYELYERIFKKHFKVVTNAHKEIIKLVEAIKFSNV